MKLKPFTKPTQWGNNIHNAIIASFFGYMKVLVLFMKKYSESMYLFKSQYNQISEPRSSNTLSKLCFIQFEKENAVVEEFSDFAFLISFGRSELCQNIQKHKKQVT